MKSESASQGMVRCESNVDTRPPKREARARLFAVPSFAHVFSSTKTVKMRSENMANKRKRFKRMRTESVFAWRMRNEIKRDNSCVFSVSFGNIASFSTKTGLRVNETSSMQTKECAFYLPNPHLHGGSGLGSALRSAVSLYPGEFSRAVLFAGISTNRVRNCMPC